MNLVIGNKNDSAQIEANMSVVHNILNSVVEAVKIVVAPTPRLAMAA